MKAHLHPIYFENCQVSCACGNTFTTGATVEKIQVEVCSNCHPFFTGEMKFVDTLGRVEKFEKSRKVAKELNLQKARVLTERKDSQRPQSLRDMIDLAKKQANS